MASASAALSRPLIGTKGGKVQSRDSTYIAHREASRIGDLISFSALQPPPRLVECLRVTKPIFEGLVAVLRILAPVAVACYKVLYRLYSITPVNELLMIYGLALCFFGGKYCASIAAVEAFRRTGGEKLVICLQEVVANIRTAHAASLADDKVDADGNGVMDVCEISSQEWYKRKVSVVLKAVDPDVLAQALAGLYQGFLGIIMTLKFKFAWCVALACSIADMLRKPIGLIATPILVALLPKEHHKWINQIINFTLKAVAVHMAWKLQMLVSAVQSGFMGAGLVGVGIVNLVCNCGKADRTKPFDPDRSYLDTAIGIPLGLAGVWFQVRHNFTLPFPMNIALLPLTILEEVLRFCITWFPVSDSLPGQ